MVVSKDGKLVFSHASGTRGSERQEPMTLDSTFWIASCTKMIDGIAAMQLCEQGKLALDDADLIERFAPKLNKTTKGNTSRKKFIWLKILDAHW